MRKDVLVDIKEITQDLFLAICLIILALIWYVVDILFELYEKSTKIFRRSKNETTNKT